MSQATDLLKDIQATDNTLGYRPGKEERKRRAFIWSRYNAMKDDPGRKEAEEEWTDGDKQFRMYAPPKDADDWRANFVLPDAFAAVQADAQEKIDRKSRPLLRAVGDDDGGKTAFGNAIMAWNMNRTGFDYQYFLSKYAAAIRGTSFLWDNWRTDEREVMDPTSVNPDGTLKYEKKTITDFDDDYTEWVENEWIFLDPAGDHISKKRDLIRRQILDIDEFNRIYGLRPDFKNTQLVRPGGELNRTAFFRQERDIADNEVEVLHYYNRSTDRYDVLANNVVVREGYLPTKHKELPLTPIYHYYVPGRFWGFGIPRVIKSQAEERTAVRRLRLDRVKMQTNKMFLVDDRVDIDEEDAVVRPHGFIEVNTGGVPLSQVITPLEYGDIPASSYKEEEAMLEDIRRAHGIDDRIQGVNVGGTATESALLKESSLKRVNLIAQLAEMDSLTRLGKLKWSNIQFFYPDATVEHVIEDNEDREKKIYRTVSAEGQKFEIVKDSGTNQQTLKLNSVEGSASFKLDPKHAKFMEGDWDYIVDAEAFTVLSKPIQQAKITELLTLIASQPAWLNELEAKKSMKRTLEIFDEKPKNWLKGGGKTDQEWKEMAEWENIIMAGGVMLSPTPDAPIAHTEVHLDYTKTAEYQQLSEPLKAILTQHIQGEHDANPATGSFAEAAAAAGGANPTGNPVGAPSQPGGPAITGADLTPSTVTGEASNNPSGGLGAPAA
jgi:hypothetical protein